MPQHPEPAIVVDRLVKAYKATTAVDGISFALAPGSITGLLGGNGAGKTTTIATIMGLVLPTSGSVRVLGAEMPRQRYRVLHRMNFESPYVELPMRLTVRQNLRVFGMLYGIEAVEERIAAVAGQLELTEFLDRQAGKISAGQKTRVALAKALINARIRRTGCAAGSSGIGSSAARRCCWRHTTWPRWSACVNASSS
jgi:ABC-2 type transport system ATP-binding protein